MHSLYNVTAVIKYSSDVFRIHSTREMRIAVMFTVAVCRTDPLQTNNATVVIANNVYHKTAIICARWLVEKRIFEVVHYQKITIYPVLKNFRDAVLKVYPGCFFSEKYIENARMKWKNLFIRALPRAYKSEGIVLLFLCSIVLFSIILWIYANFCRFSSKGKRNGKSHSPYFRAK